MVGGQPPVRCSDVAPGHDQSCCVTDSVCYLVPRTLNITPDDPGCHIMLIGGGGVNRTASKYESAGIVSRAK